MDELVRKAMQKWPNVPDCYNWLGLDARGEFWMRDAQTQSAGAFQTGCAGSSAALKGSRVDHPALRRFMNRNYQADGRGCWYFQNGPQKVFVELEWAPLVCRVNESDPNQMLLHTGEIGQLLGILSDEAGVVYAEVRQGLAVVHSLDVYVVADQIERSEWALTSCLQAELPERYGFVRSPAQLMGR